MNTQPKNPVYSGALLLFTLVCALTLSCAQKQAEVQKLEMEMLATSVSDSNASATDSTTLPTATPPAADSQSLAMQTEQPVNIVDTTSPTTEPHAGATDSIQGTAQTESHFDPDQVPNDTEKQTEEFVRRPGAYVGSGGYTLQIASTDSRGYAEELVALFKQRGYQPYITEITVDGTTRYRVRIGQYANSIEAQKTLADLEQQYGVVGWVAQVH